MSYTVLARKYRSPTFDDVVGQEPIATTLKNAIATSRIHHGYLFTGTRGVGKTSMARILAKALNCLKSDGPTPQPCNNCDSCLAIAAGEDIDVLEIDAASNTGVDNIRELRSNAIYRPARSRFKIYIIDEVHMLSTGAFNALLKTLEEPPGHVKFIMATTEPQKVPATIQSRVQRFDFRPIPPAAITGQLTRICQAEGINAEPAALRRIARLAGGSMRDALSLLDQLHSIGARKISLELLEQVLPRPGDEQVCQLVDKLIARDAAASLAVVDTIIASGHAMESLVIGLMEHIRGMMLLRVCGSQTELVDATDALRAQMIEQAKAFDEPAYVFMLAMLEELRRSVRYSGTSRAMVEAVIVRLCMLDAFTSLRTVAEAVGGRPAGTVSRLTGTSSGVASGPTAFRGPRGATRPAEPPNRPVASTRGAGPSGTPSEPSSYGPPADTGTGTRALPARDGSSPVPQGLGPPVSRRANSQDIKKVTADPVVRRAIELFEGTLVGVRPLMPAGPAASAQDRPADSPPVEHPLERETAHEDYE
jgi:DNA polymerase-3 subunit gamma/tau